MTGGWNRRSRARHPAFGSESQILHGAADDIAKAQRVMNLATQQRRHGYLAAHLDQQRIEIFVFEKTLATAIWASKNV